jgi:YegS/Rv2252/BmrU family lipid kinase
VAVVVNPISGLGSRPGAASQRAAQAAAVCEAHGYVPEVFVTERHGHARELAAAAVSRGCALVVAWGGDGTVNEVGSALAFTDTALGIVPAGSGNGLARELGVPLDPPSALAAVLRSAERVIDAGELDGRLFFNVAGCGLDARVARGFAESAGGRRGLRRYVRVTVRELLAYEPDDLTIEADGTVMQARPLILAFANSGQYGNGARIAPRARLDDGRLDVVVVGHRPVWRVVRQVPKLFSGTIDRAPDVTMLVAAEITVRGAGAILCHVDGEPYAAGSLVTVRARARALRVRWPGISGDPRAQG